MGETGGGEEGDIGGDKKRRKTLSQEKRALSAGSWRMSPLNVATGRFELQKFHLGCWTYLAY